MNRRNPSKQKQRVGQDTELKAVLRKHKAEGLKVRRANAHLLLDKGHSASFVADVLFLDADTVRRWRRGFEKYGMASLDLAEYPEREGHLTTENPTFKVSNATDTPLYPKAGAPALDSTFTFYLFDWWPLYMFPLLTDCIYPSFLFSARSPDNVNLLLLSLLHGPHSSMRLEI